HLAIISIGAGLWIASVLVRQMTTLGASNVFKLAFVPSVVVIVIPLFGWLVHRVAAALVTTAVIMGGGLRDPRSLCVVRAYERAFLWIFCVFDGVFLTLVFFQGNWIRRAQQHLLGHAVWVAGIPQEPLAFMAGNVVLCLIWL